MKALALDMKGGGANRKTPPRPPQHSTAEIAREIGVSTATLMNVLRKDGAPEPVRKKAVTGKQLNFKNYYNRQEVLAYLRQIGVLK